MLWQSEAWRYRRLPLLLAVVGVVAAYWLQEVGIVRRHALLLALLVGLGFFHPTLRHPLLILFGYGLSLYFLSKSLGSWADAPFGGLEPVDRWLWLLVGLLCAVSAMGMGRPTPPRWASAVLLFALGIYFITYTHSEIRHGNTLQVVAGAGLALVAFVAGLASLIEAYARPHAHRMRSG